MQRLKQFSSKDEIVALYKQHNTPIVVIENYVYLPARDCIIGRDSGGDTENRDAGGDTEGRNAGGDKEGRNTGGDHEGRTTGGFYEARNTGGDKESRDTGGDTEDRNTGGGAEGRNAGGDTEGRNLGGDASKIKCLALVNGSSFKIYNANTSRPIGYYDGYDFRETTRRIIEY